MAYKFNPFSGVLDAASSRTDFQNGSSALTLDAFGDSFSVGSVAFPLTNGWVYLLAKAKGWALTNHAISGSQVQDQLPILYNSVVPARGMNFTFGLGTNDLYGYQTTPGRLDIYRGGCLAGISYLAIPNGNGNKYLANDSSIAYAGTWSASPLSSFGQVSTTNGSTATFTVAGRTIYIATQLLNSNGGSFTVTIDGKTQFLVNPGTYTNATNIFSCAPYSTTIVSSIGTVNNSAYVFRFAGLTNGSHTVVITVNSATSASNQVFIDWVAGAGGAKFSDGPNVFVAGITRATAAQYATAFTAEVTNQIYNKNLLDVCNELAGDGLNVVFMDFSPYINPLTSDVEAAGLHPTNIGHAKLLQVALQATNSLGAPADRMGANALGFLLPEFYVDKARGFSGFNTVYPHSELEIFSSPFNTGICSPQLSMTGFNVEGHYTGIQFYGGASGSLAGSATVTTLGFIGSIVRTGGGAGHIVFTTNTFNTGEFMRYDANAACLGLKTALPTKDFSLGGTAPRTIWLERNTTAATAGQSLTVQGGGAIAGTNNLAGGDAIISGGISTGTGESGVQLKGFVAGASGSSDNSASTMFQILGNRMGLNGATPIAKPTITGSKGSNAALISLLSALAARGDLIDSTT